MFVSDFVNTTRAESKSSGRASIDIFKVCVRYHLLLMADPCRHTLMDMSKHVIRSNKTILESGYVQIPTQWSLLVQVSVKRRTKK